MGASRRLSWTTAWRCTQVTTGGSWVASKAMEVEVADPPALSVAANPLTVQPATFTAECDMEASLLVTVSSQGRTGRPPRGPRGSSNT